MLVVHNCLNGRAPSYQADVCIPVDTLYQDVDSSVLLLLVSCWSPGQVSTSADVGSLPLLWTSYVERPASLSTDRQQIF